MDQWWSIIGLALLPAAGNFTGGLIAEFWKPSPKALGMALHGASGIVIAIIALELLPESRGALSGWGIGAAFMVGGVLYIGMEAIADRLTGGEAKQAGSRMWMIYGAVMVDLLSDVLRIGAGGAVSLSLALTLAAGQVLADVPEGFAAAATFRANNVPRRRRILLMASFAIPVVGAAVFANAVLRGAPEIYRFGALAVISGMLAVAAIEDMIGEAHEAAKDSKRSVLAFTGGFALFAFVSAAIGE